MIEIKPNGHYVLIEACEVSNKSQGGIVLATGQTEKFEKDAVEFGVIKAFGPLAFHGVTGCVPHDYPTGHPRFSMEPHEIWGVKVGDTVEFRRYDGKKTAIKELGALRYIPDTQIVGTVIGDFELNSTNI